MMPFELRILFLLSVAFLGVRAYAARIVGFGDSEALYACYAMHPQPAYLDHPGLIGLVARAIGGGSAPTPGDAHAITAVLGTLVPLLVAVAARAAGASVTRAALAGVVTACAPVIGVGLFALTPDLLLALGWTIALALAAAGLRAKPGTTAAAGALLGAGLVAGVASTAKISGLLLVLALAATYAGDRTHRKSPWPWAGLAAGLLAFAPVALHAGPMLRHRFVAQAGLSWRGLGMLFGGQIAYVSPLLLAVTFVALRAAWRARRGDSVDRLAFMTVFIPLVPLALFSTYSRAAEPHWIAPALLALPIAWAKSDAPAPVSPRFTRAACALGLAMTAAAHAWVLVPSLAQGGTYDIARELYGWPQVIREVERTPLPSGADDAVVVGPHWVVCAQLHAALGPKFPVGCATPERDDFDDWLPRDEWKRAGSILFVTDDRFDVDVEHLFPDRSIVAQERVTTTRGGRPSRVFTLRVLERKGSAAL